MGYSYQQRKRIFERTDGRCHLCGRKRYFNSYARFDMRGNWEVDHGLPRSLGGSDRSRNLYVACISCNRSKGSQSSERIRIKYGLIRPPMSRQEREEKEEFWSTITTFGLFIGGAFLLKLLADANRQAPEYTYQTPTPLVPDYPNNSFHLNTGRYA